MPRSPSQPCAVRCPQVNSLTRLDHPNIIRCLGCVASTPTYCLVLEFCEGGDLYDCMRRPAGTPPGFTMTVGTGIVAALGTRPKIALETSPCAMRQI